MKILMINWYNIYNTLKNLKIYSNYMFNLCLFYMEFLLHRVSLNVLENVLQSSST